MRYVILQLMKVSAFAALLLPAGVAQASGSITISYGPLAAVPALGEFSTILTILLGLLMVVVALRMLFSSRRAQNFLGLILLGGGVITGGLGVNDSLAGGDFFTVPHEGPDRFCSGGEINYNGDIPPITLNNQCDFALAIAVKEDFCTGPPAIIPQRVVPAKTEGELPHCVPPP